MFRRIWKYKWRILAAMLAGIVVLVVFLVVLIRQSTSNSFLVWGPEPDASLNIPRTFDDAAMASLELPLARADASPVQIPSRYYYGIGVRPVFKSYPIYHPDKEPPGYLDWLAQQDPQVEFDPAQLKTSEDWIRAGELVFEAPSAFGHIAGPNGDLFVRDREWHREVAPPLLKDGVMAGMRYVIRKRGAIEIGTLSCALCHSRVMPDGTLVKGAQGNFPFDRAFAWDYDHMEQATGVPSWLSFFTPSLARGIEMVLYGASWLNASDPTAEIDRMSPSDIAARHRAIPPGVLARHGTRTDFPARVPDLIGVKDRRYLDATGLVQHRSIGDLMRYAAMNQDTDVHAMYFGRAPSASMPLGLISLPENPAKYSGGRYSDEQLYALALYLYSLSPPPNPNPYDATAKAGEAIFKREGCNGCHTPPLYTNNKLTLAMGFTPPPEDLRRFDILPVSVGTNPVSATQTRRGTGYYKVPSLKGLWYRGPFEHNGSVAKLEDWFDVNRLREDYVPTGFKGLNMKSRAVLGHPFGLNLTPEEKRQLIAFLKTL